MIIGVIIITSSRQGPTRADRTPAAITFRLTAALLLVTCFAHKLPRQLAQARMFATTLAPRALLLTPPTQRPPLRHGPAPVHSAAAPYGAARRCACAAVQPGGVEPRPQDAVTSSTATATTPGAEGGERPPPDQRAASLPGPLWPPAPTAPWAPMQPSPCTARY